MGAAHGNMEHLSAEHIRGAHAACDDCGARAVNRGVRSLCPAATEFHHAVALCGAHNARGLGRNEALVVDDVQKRGFNELCLHNRRNHLDQGFARENDRALRNRVDITGKAEVPEIREEGGLKDAETLQIVNLVFREVQVFDIVDQLLQTGANRVAVALRIVAVKHVEDDSLIDILIFKIALHHREFVQVCQ